MEKSELDKIDRYLNQICHGIAGPRALRNHIRQELKEHLLDALAQYKAAGLPDDQALARTLEDFGGPDLVRSELEATHGHRLMTVILDKALLWKEKTMKARWLWSSGALITLLLTITIQCLFLIGIATPFDGKIEYMYDNGFITDAPNSYGLVAWSVHYLEVVSSLFQPPLWFILLLALLWFLFEWRVRNEHKSFIRLTILGFISVGLMVTTFFAGAAIAIPIFAFNSNATSNGSEQFVLERLGNVDHAVAQLDQAAATNDWIAVRTHLQQMDNIPAATPPVLILIHERILRDRLYANFRDTRTALNNMEDSLNSKDPARIKDALQKLHAAYDPIHQFAISEPLTSTPSSSPPSTTPAK